MPTEGRDDPKPGVRVPSVPRCVLMLCWRKSSFFAGLAIGCASQRPPLPSATGGVLDLRSWDFQRDGVVRLKGDWDFFPRVLLRGEAGLLAPRSGERRVPDLWTDKTMGSARGIGAGTYRLTVLLPDRRPSLGIKYTTVSTAFELDADGLLVANVGRPALDSTRDLPTYKPGVAILPRSAASLVLVVRASNYEYTSRRKWRPFISAISRLSSVGTGPGRSARSPWPRPWPFWPYYSHSSLEEASKAGVLFTFASFP